MSLQESNAAQSLSLELQEQNSPPFDSFRLKAQAGFLGRFYHTLWDQVDGSGDTGSPDLSVAESRLLRFLLRSGPSRMCDLSSGLGYPTSTLTYMVERLTKSGYIDRKRDLSDRRAIRVHLGQKAESYLQQKNSGLLQMCEEVLVSLDDQERRMLTSLLGKVLAEIN